MAANSTARKARKKTGDAILNNTRVGGGLTLRRNIVDYFITQTTTAGQISQNPKTHVTGVLLLYIGGGGGVRLLPNTTYYK